MRTIYIVVPAVMSVMLAAFSAPAMAACCDVTTVKTGTVINGKVIMQEGPGGNSWTFTVPDGDVQFVRIHWHCWMQSGDSSATFTNSQGYQQQITIPMNNQTADYGHWECGFGTSHNYWTVNATPGQNTISGITNCDCMWKFVDIVVDNTTEPATHNGRWWLNQGLIKVENYNTWFNGSINPNSNHTLWTAQSHHENMKIYFNDVLVDDYTASDWFDVRQNSVSNIDSDGSQKVTWENTEEGEYPDFFVWAAMLAEEAPQGNHDLVVSDIAFQPETPRPEQSFTVNATISNQGNAGTGTAFNVGLWIDGSFYDKKSTGPLGAGDSETVSFTNVNLPEGCHNFTVIADCDGDVSESDEENNVKTRYYQVGYAIVVRSNADFDELVNEGLATKVDNTYYIEDMEITNCGGCGITIENTTVPFVINNCTVQHCGYDSSGSLTGYCGEHYCSGICMENVTNGRINACTVYNNSAKGISILKDSTRIDITNNTISWHTERDRSYGIELGRPKHIERPKFVNVTNNTLFNNAYGIDLIGSNCTVKCNSVRNNTAYGIYVYGNDSKIYNNTIENNADYGIKLYNSSGNCIYANTISNNNITGHQAYDGWEGNPGLALNHWNSTLELCYYNDTGVCCTNYIGNNWSDYTGSDGDGDKIGDSPYDIDGATNAQDNAPLMVPWVNYNRVKCGDVNGDGGPGVRDAVAIIFNDIDTCEWAADVNCDCGVSIRDAVAIVFNQLNCCDPCYCCAG